MNVLINIAERTKLRINSYIEAMSASFRYKKEPIHNALTDSAN